MRRTDGGVISGGLRSISTGMVWGHPGLPTCLTLHSQMMIPTPLQFSFSGGSSPLRERPVVPDVSDNRRPERRMMIGTRTTPGDWQWLDEMMGEDVPAVRPTQKIRRMPEGH
ncbi:hypothetical protein PIB30_055639 [Stylosanthes scabra]|uniref:Uncharacterized protein n=1 Tax=Stylosanthes scabra TaxID=79078 RepID=A0ABU6SKT9_9FABA|nr:hypothetical protein [Stylosanthes scabra]